MDRVLGSHAGLSSSLLDGLRSRLLSGRMGSNQSKSRGRPNSISSKCTKQTLRRLSDLRFRVLVIGSANAGKTSILQRVCETTESPKIYRGGKEVRHGGLNLFVRKSDLTADQFKLDPSMEVSDD